MEAPPITSKITQQLSTSFGQSSYGGPSTGNPIGLTPQNPSSSYPQVTDIRYEKSIRQRTSSYSPTTCQLHAPAWSAVQAILTPVWEWLWRRTDLAARGQHAPLLTRQPIHPAAIRTSQHPILSSDASFAQEQGKQYHANGMVYNSRFGIEERKFIVSVYETSIVKLLE